MTNVPRCAIAGEHSAEVVTVAMFAPSSREVRRRCQELAAPQAEIGDALSDLDSTLDVLKNDPRKKPILVSL